jgi:hypothetical protein
VAVSAVELLSVVADDMAAAAAAALAVETKTSATSGQYPVPFHAKHANTSTAQ